MTRLRNKAVISLTIVGLLAMSGIAMASSHQEEKNDTVGNYFYDADNDFLFWNVTSLESQSVNYEALYAALLADCTLEAGPYTYSYDGAAITLTPAVNQNCSALTGNFVYGPNNQINHGTVMKMINSMIDGPGRGCIIREFAKSGVGQDDKQTPDPEFVAPDPSATAIGSDMVEFMTFQTDCIHGKKAKDGDESNRGGPPEHVLQKKAEKWGTDGKPGKGPKN